MCSKLLIPFKPVLPAVFPVLVHSNSSLPGAQTKNLDAIIDSFSHSTSNPAAANPVCSNRSKYIYTLVPLHLHGYSLGLNHHFVVFLLPPYPAIKTQIMLLLCTKSSKAFHLRVKTKVCKMASGSARTVISLPSYISMPSPAILVHTSASRCLL